MTTEREILRKAIVEVFDRDGMRRILGEGNPTRQFDALVSENDFGMQVFELIDRAYDEGWIEDLVDAVLKEFPGNQRFVAAVRPIAEKIKTGVELPPAPALTSANIVKLPPIKASSVAPAPNVGSFSQPSDVKVNAVYEGEQDPYAPARKVFDVVLANRGSEHRSLISFDVRWVFLKGYGESATEGFTLTAVEQYSIELPINDSTPNKLMKRSVPLYPPLVIPASGLTSVRLEVLLKISGAISTTWDVLYDIRIQDDQGKEIAVLSRSWGWPLAEGTERRDWVADYQSTQK